MNRKVVIAVKSVLGTKGIASRRDEVKKQVTADGFNVGVSCYVDVA